MDKNPYLAFESVWRRIEAHAGETFTHKKGGEFKYEVKGSIVIPDRTNHHFAKSQLEQAHDRMPLNGPGEISDLRGPSYIFAILTDPRITS